MRCAGDEDATFFGTTEFHAHLASAAAYEDTVGGELFLDLLGDLCDEAFLNLWASCKVIDDTGNATKTDHLRVGNVGDINGAKKWDEVVYAEAMEGECTEHDGFR